VEPTLVKVLEASWKGQIDTLDEVLSKYSGDITNLINCSDNGGRTPLMIASAFGHSQVVYFLLQKGKHSAF
jgi:ankyrin repeat protein